VILPALNDDGMVRRRLSSWRGRVVGMIVGLLVGGLNAAAASSEYIDEPKIGLTWAAVAGLLSFAVGVWWDRRTARTEAGRERQRQWRAVFTEEPTGHRLEPSGIDEVLELLDPRARVVPFERAHLQFVTAIRRWCVERQPGRVWLLAGGPGAGKTRVAMRLADNLRHQQTEPWSCGWLIADGDRAARAVELAAEWSRPVLIIVDDADLRTDLVTLLAAVQQADVDERQVRLLLIAREFGGWWTAVQQVLRGPVQTAAEHTWVGSLADEVPGQRVAAQRAALAFAQERNDITVTPEDVAVSGIQAETPALLLHATVLEAVLRAADGRREPVDVDEAVASLLHREREGRWQRNLSRQGLQAYPQVTLELLRDALVLAMLVGSTDAADAGRLLRRLPALADASPTLIDKMIIWLGLYGVVAGYHVRPHLPGVLAEHLIADALAENPTLATAVMSGAGTQEQASYALAFVARAAAHLPVAQVAARTLIEAAPHRLLPLAIAQTRIGIGPLDHAIVAAIPAADLDWSTTNDLYQRISHETQVLMHTAVALAHVKISRAPDEANRVEALKDYAYRLLMAGRLREAVDSAQEAVIAARILADADPDAYQPHLGHALGVLPVALVRAGRSEEAVELAQEAVAVWRALADANPDAYLHQLGDALTQLADALRKVGCSGEAVDAAQEAVAVWRAFADANPDAYLHHLGGALTQLSAALQKAGRSGEAVDAAQEAVTVWRALADANPDAYLHYLGGALTQLSAALQEAGRSGDAVDAARNGVTVQRLLADANPAVHQHYLGHALTRFSAALLEADRPGEAVDAARGGVIMLRVLADANPDAYQQCLSGSLTELLRALLLAGGLREAVDAAREGVLVRRALADANPDTHPSGLANALAALAATLWDVGQEEQAVAEAREAIGLYQLVPDGERLFADNLRILHNLTGDAAPLAGGVEPTTDAAMTDPVANVGAHPGPANPPD
jgi:tetratricopeptide (TPR) repeat protein